MKDCYQQISESEYTVKAGTDMDSLARELHQQKKMYPVAFEMQGLIFNLATILESDQKVRFITRKCDCGQRIFERSMILIFLAAAKDILPDREVFVEHSLSGGVYITIEKQKANSRLKKQLIARMQEFIRQDAAITKEVLPKEDVKAYFEEKKYFDKYYMLNYLCGEDVAVYSLGNEKETFYGELIPSCGYVEDFDIEIHGDGFVLLFPDLINQFELPNFSPRHNLARTFHEWGRYVQIMDIATVAELNYHIRKGRTETIIKVSEEIGRAHV